MGKSLLQVSLLAQTPSGPRCPMVGVTQLSPALGGVLKGLLGTRVLPHTPACTALTPATGLLDPKWVGPRHLGS